MFEHFCSVLLRLYPTEFRRAYGCEAAQLMRDRVRNERGLLRRMRLLVDLASDLCATCLYGWQSARPSPAPVNGTPRFSVIDVHGTRPEALAVGMLMSIFMFATFTLSLHPNAPPHVANASGSQGAGVVSNGAGQQSDAKDSEARHTLLAAIAANLKQLYVDRSIGQRLGDAVLAHDTNGDYQSLDMGASLAARVNEDLQATSRALGIPRGIFVADVVYSAQPLPTGPPPPMTAEARERSRATMLQQHCWFETIETLPSGVGYLKLNGFADASACQETTDRAMGSLNGASALIVDLRDNTGGFGETALQIAGYLFGRPTYMFDPRPHSPVPARTASPISGNKLVDKPVYVLTSSSTQSAAEYFVYNLKMLGRATVVGETTAGHQHSGAFHRIDDHFGMGIQEVAPPDNPYPVKGWEVIGIEPDVKAPRRKALDVARQLAELRR